MSGVLNFLKVAGGRIEELSVSDLRVKLRAGIDAGNWPQRGNAVFEALATNDRPVVLAIDELPILINRLLRDDGSRITQEGTRMADAFLSWLRKNGQAHRGQVSIILSGSVGLEPLLEQAGLIAHANIFAPYDLEAWNEETAVSCLGALAQTYRVGLPLEIRRDMCRRLRCCVPHHVQMFFDKMHDHLRRAGRPEASPDDAEWVYLHEMLSVRGQADLQHYEGRLETILGREAYPIALEVLTETAVRGRLDGDFINRCRTYFTIRDEDDGKGITSFEDVLHVLLHDGYLERHEGGFRFISGLLEDWWRSRYGHNFVSVVAPGQHDRVNAPMTVIARKYNPGFLSDDELVESFCVRSGRARIDGRSSARVLGKLKHASDRHRPARQWKDESAVAYCRRDTSGTRPLIAFLSDRLLGGKLRGLHRR